MKKGSLNRTRFVYKRCISLTKMASGVQNWRFVYKYAVFNLQTSISPYKLASRITTQHYTLHRFDSIAHIFNLFKFAFNFIVLTLEISKTTRFPMSHPFNPRVIILCLLRSFRKSSDFILFPFVFPKPEMNYCMVERWPMLQKHKGAKK